MSLACSLGPAHDAAAAAAVLYGVVHAAAAPELTVRQVTCIVVLQDITLLLGNSRVVSYHTNTHTRTISPALHVVENANSKFIKIS